MPTAPTYPGVYIEEIPSGVRTITGVATSITAFVGRAARGRINDPSVINNFGDFERRFGGLAPDSTMSYAVRDFYQNGGSQAVIVRIARGATAARIPLPTGEPAPGDALTLAASSEGAWGNNLRVAVDFNTRDPADADLFNLTIFETVDGEDVAIEKFFNVSVNRSDADYLPRVLKQRSALVRVPEDAAGEPILPVDAVTGSGIRPLDTLEPESPPSSPPRERHRPVTATAGSGRDGETPEPGDYTGSKDAKTGIFALEKADLFNLLCVPPPTRGGNTDAAVWSAALAYCVERRAMLIVDPNIEWALRPEDAVSRAIGGLDELGLTGTAARNGALYFPRVLQPDQLLRNAVDTFVPCGIVAGVMSRTDAQRGVWKAPAGLDAALNGVRGLQVNLTDEENGQLNPLGINCLRSFPVTGRVVWGARTLRGADQLADEYKYVPVRRMALFLEESLYRGTQWVVFEPNDEPLWAQIRLNIGAFMQNLFRQGAFQGRTPREAYLVKCDAETTTQNDINLGIVNILVGFAPLKPAEFVIIKIQQLAGQVET
jgi:phage tail sheath protein FI